MPDYSKAKIYKIVNNIDNEIYIGATIQPLSERMAKHRY
jgi:predicted GIY-YIG superfamily endonuclease